MAGVRLEPGAPFTAEEAEDAAQRWGANCGPGALAAILNLSLDLVHPHLPGFDRKRYTNPTMMRSALDSLKVQYDWQVRGASLPPLHGLARVQWTGPWTQPGVPPVAAYRHTHWIASRFVQAAAPNHRTQIFDINCMSVGGWVDYRTWMASVVPHILKYCEPKADGDWRFTHIVEIRHGTKIKS